VKLLNQSLFGIYRLIPHNFFDPPKFSVIDTNQRDIITNTCHHHQPQFKRIKSTRCQVCQTVFIKSVLPDVVEKLYPVATGPAAELVAAHQAPQSLEFYSGYYPSVPV
jgi:hypothetical protein